MCKPSILAVLVVLCLASCADDPPAPPYDPAPTLMLPDAYYGTWEQTGTSGGIDGRGLPEAGGTPARIVLTRENTIERRGPDGATTTQGFTVWRGKSIFSTEKQWMIAFERGGPELVLQLGEDGSLGVADNVYDGYSFAYRRVDE